MYNLLLLLIFTFLLRINVFHKKTKGSNLILHLIVHWVKIIFTFGIL